MKTTKNRRAFLLIMIVVLFVLIPFSVPAQAEDEVFDFFLSIEPAELLAPGTVTVSIRVANMKGDQSFPILLTDPDGQAVTTFGDDGQALLKQGEYVTAQDEYYVTQEQLAQGYLTYALQYFKIDKDGNVGIQKQERTVEVFLAQTQEVEMVIVDNPENAAMILFHLEYDHDAIQMISSRLVREDKGSLLNMGGLPIGEKVLATFKIQKDALAGEYSISIVVDEAIDINEEYVNGPEFTTPVIRVKNKIEVGDYLTFGHYPQTKEGTDNTPIEWLVLDYDAANNNALLISQYALDSQPYHHHRVINGTSVTDEATWETCSLRKWLNEDFISNAFSEIEQKAILITSVDNSCEQSLSGYSTDGGNNTQDKVFLLSYNETGKYLSDKNAKLCVLTDYNTLYQSGYHSNIMLNGKTTCRWWLRSTGESLYKAFFVLNNGARLDDRNDNWLAVRPALWVNLDSEAF